MNNVTQFANEAETIAHFQHMFETFGRLALGIWSTEDGKWIDEGVLLSLAKKGVITQIRPVHYNMYSESKWIFRPEYGPKEV